MKPINLRVSPLQEEILSELAVFMYLTNSQLLKLKVSKSERSLNRQLSDLEQKKFIRTIRFDGVPKRESFHTLTATGSKLVWLLTGRDPETIPFPKSTTWFDYDFFHRKLTIDYHIALVQWVRDQNGGNSHHRIHDPISLAIFDRYFEATGANQTIDPLKPRLSAKTRVQYGRKKRLYPDVNFMIRDRRSGENIPHLFSLEVSRWKSSPRIIEQITRHMEVMTTGFLPEKYGFKMSYQVLFLFEEVSLARFVMTWFSAVVPEVWHPYFLFGLAWDALLDPVGSWYRADGENVCFISKI